MPMRSLIVDDEPLARERVRNFLASEPDFEIASECGNGKEALAFLSREKVDLIFLDIVMPEMNGFELARALSPPDIPHIIFVTVFDSYALEAFEVHAVDYLLKPVDRERFRVALEHLRSRRLDRASARSWDDRITRLLRDLAPSNPVPERLSLKLDGEIVFLDPASIRWMESAGNYVMVHSDTKEKLVRETLANMETRCEPFGFTRISRSAIVNISSIDAVKPCGFGEYTVRLHDGSQLTLSRSYRQAFFRRMNAADPV
jgi:two-component system LytT family response regulator